jgi:carboxymethylenebutenolidase
MTNVRVLVKHACALLLPTVVALGCHRAPVPRALPTTATPPAAEIVAFPSGTLALRGVLYRPGGAGPFPAVLYNHGSAPGMANSQAFEALGPLFAGRGWVFFAPYRRGQGLSAAAGPYIGDEIEAAKLKGGLAAGSAMMVRLLEGDHLQDQLAALAWLRKASFVAPGRIAAAGNSFGGIETLLGAEKEAYCAAVDASGGAQSWTSSPELQTVMTRAARNARAPVLFFQAENDFDLAPTHTLSAAMKEANKPYEAKIYPRFGSSPPDGHSFAWRGSSVWFEDVLAFLQRHCDR